LEIVSEESDRRGCNFCAVYDELELVLFITSWDA
jgi:hypothetical protein